MTRARRALALIVRADPDAGTDDGHCEFWT